MKLNRIAAENFQSFESIDIDMSNITLSGIIGRFKNNSEKSNGSGKTTIFNIVQFAIYGDGRVGTQKELIKTGNNTAWVMVEFEKDNNKIKIERYLKGKSATVKVEVNKKDKSETGDTQKIINNIMGMDSKVFSATVFFEQEDNDEFTGATPGKRKEYLKNILGLNFYDDCYKENSNRIKKIKTDIEVLEGKKSVLQEAAGEQSVESIDLDLIEAVDQIEMIDKDLGEKENIFNKYKKSSLELKSIKEQLKTENNSLEKVNESIGSYTEEVKEYKEYNEEVIQDLKGQNLKTLKEKLSKSERLENKYSNEKDKINQELLKLKAEVNSIKTIAVKFKEKDDCYVCNNKIKSIDKEKMLNQWRSQFKDIKKKIDLLENNLKTVKSSFDTYCNESTILNKKILKFNNVQESVDRNNKNIESREKKIKFLEDSKKKTLDKISNLREKQIQFKKDKNIDVEIISEEIEELKENRDEWIQKKAKAEQELKKAKKYEKNIKQLNREIREKEKYLRAYEILRNIFGKNGITASIIGASLIDIEDDANEILQEIDGNGKVIKFENFKETKKGLSDTLEIWIDTKTGTRKYESFSKGQQVIENFSIRMGLAKTLLRKDGSWIGVGFLDEVFANLDKYNRRKVVGVLNYLTGVFNQILVISHTDIQDVFPSLIEVEFNSTTETSRIKGIS